MTKAAFSVWDNRIAPVFDVARQMFLLETDAGSVISETFRTLDEDLSLWKALTLADLGIEVLICGAISRNLAEAVSSYGIYLIPFVAGDLEEVKGAWLTGRLDNRKFAMPGCCGRRGLGWNVSDAEMEECAMRGENSGGRGQGAGMGWGGKGRGRGGGASVAGPDGNCVCPGCGHIEPHEAGVPCMGIQCPKCGRTMVRE
jgi:predicted Fe-Mo cluster-binding NifX family protein